MVTAVTAVTAVPCQKVPSETSPRSQHMVCLERRYPTLQANVSQETISLAFNWLHELDTTNYCILALMLHACMLSVVYSGRECIIAIVR
jgi:hypothetical protein